MHTDLARPMARGVYTSSTPGVAHHALGGALAGSCPSATAAQPPWLSEGQLSLGETALAVGPGNLLKGRASLTGVRGLQESHVLRNTPVGTTPASWRRGRR